jgi:hypothetical protein
LGIIDDPQSVQIGASDVVTEPAPVAVPFPPDCTAAAPALLAGAPLGSADAAPASLWNSKAPAPKSRG